jgi:hypothetical protein
VHLFRKRAPLLCLKQNPQELDTLSPAPLVALKPIVSAEQYPVCEVPCVLVSG